MLFFVYGTLKSGYGNNRLLKTSKTLGEAITAADDYSLTDCGFPYATPFVGDRRILGEVYSVEDEGTVQNLDWLEGNGSHYTRRLVEVELLPSNTIVDAWIYEVGPEVSERYPACPVNENHDAYEWSR